MIDTTGIPRYLVLKALYDNARPQGLGFLHYTPEPMTETEAEQLLTLDTYFDYVHGRVLKVSLKHPYFDEQLYDRDNGAGAAQKVIDALRRVK